jgi:hypothetical protein
VRRPVARLLGLGVLGLALAFHAACAWAQRANFHGARPAADVRHVGDWVAHSRDNAGLPFAIVDKVGSRVYVFDAVGSLLGSTPALVGQAPGDTSVPGIGERKLSAILPEERTTPAGRFVATMARSLKGDEILWVDYDSAVALHRVIATAPKERRLQRLAGDTASERRITYGCINVPVKFFDKVVLPAFKGGTGIVYVLPEARTAREVFGSYEIAEPAR